MKGTIKFTWKEKHETDTKDPQTFRTAKFLKGIKVLPENYKWHLEVNWILCELSNESRELGHFLINVKLYKHINCIIIYIFYGIDGKLTFGCTLMTEIICMSISSVFKHKACWSNLHEIVLQLGCFPGVPDLRNFLFPKK